jgi:hypothetical protein
MIFGATITRKTVLLASLLASSMVVFASLAQSSVPGQGTPSATPDRAQAPTHKTSPYHPISVSPSAKDYYQTTWGIDNLLVRETASGNLIRFSYRVTDPARAKALGDKKATPYLFGQRSRAVLQIPVMNKIGQLRQTGLPEAGKEYWMVFSNKGNLVKPGDRVNVVIGPFHADGLMVE